MQRGAVPSGDSGRTPTRACEGQACYVTAACLEARGLAHPEHCYELCLLRLLHEEYVVKLRDGEAALADYHAKAPLVVGAIEASEDARRAYLGTFERHLWYAVGKWEEAYALWGAMRRDVEGRYLKGLSGLSEQGA